MADLMHQPAFKKNVESDYSEGKIPKSQKVKRQVLEHDFTALQHYAQKIM